jgi:hypothetical protein
MSGSNLKTVLHIVGQNDGPVRRLALARRHIETAIAHINDTAQYRIPRSPGENQFQLDELRAIVTALADIRDGLRDAERATRQDLSPDAHLTPTA